MADPKLPIDGGLPWPDNWVAWQPDPLPEGWDPVKWRNTWKGWLPISQWNLAPKAPGVYMIRCRDGRRVQMISRANGVDGNGILDIGKVWGGQNPRTLRQRLKEFYRCATNRSAYGHAAGWNYSNRCYSRRFPLDELEYTCIVTTSKKQTDNTEAALIRHYLDQFLDLPPLNFNVPSAMKDEAGPTDEDDSSSVVEDQPDPYDEGEGDDAEGEPEHNQAAAVHSSGPTRPPVTPLSTVGVRGGSPFKPAVGHSDWPEWEEFIACKNCGQVMGGPPNVDPPVPWGHRYHHSPGWTRWAGSDDDAICSNCGASGDEWLFHCSAILVATSKAGLPEPRACKEGWTGPCECGQWNAPQLWKLPRAVTNLL